VAPVIRLDIKSETVPQVKGTRRQCIAERGLLEIEFGTAGRCRQKIPEQILRVFHLAHACFTFVTIGSLTADGRSGDKDDFMASDTKMRIPLFRNSENFRTYKQGDVIFREGELGSEMYIVRKGNVELRVGERVLDTLEEDELFGEMALVDGQPRSATAVAATECELVPIDQRRFLFLVQQTPLFALQLMSLLAFRLRRMDAQFAQKS
jgi:hypothetical protein